MAENKVKYYVRIDDKYVETDMQSAEKKVSSAGSKISSATKTAGVAIGGAFVAAGTAAVKFGSEFESAFAGASTLIDTTQTDMGQLQSQILELSDKTGIAAADLSNSMYNALSAGIDLGENNAEMMAMLENSSRLAKAGFTDIDTALTATAKTMNAYGMTGEEAMNKVQKVLIQTQNKGITTVGELGSVLAQVTPTASAFGVSFEQVGASLANMTAQGTPTAQATTQLSGLISELGKSGTTASNALMKSQVALNNWNATLNDFTSFGLSAEKLTQSLPKGFKYTGQTIGELVQQGVNIDGLVSELKDLDDVGGMTFQEMMESGIGLNDALDWMAKYASAAGLSTVDMFSSLEAGKAALALSGDNSAKFAENLAAMSTEADVVGEAFDKVSDTSAEKFNKILNQLQNAAIELFVQMEPIVSDLLPVLSDLLMQLIPPVADLVTQLMPILSDLLSQLMPIITDVISAVLPVLIELLNKILPPVMTILEKLLPPLLMLFEALMPILDVIISLLDPILDLLIALLNPIVDLINGALTPLVKALQPIIDLIGKYIVFQLKAMGESFKNAFTFVSGVVQNAISTISNVLNGLISFVKNVFTGNWKGAWEAVKGIFSSTWEGIKNAFKLPVNWIIDGINSFLKGINGIKIPDWVPLVGGKGFSIPLIPRLKKGADFIPSDFYPAYLDYGERVLTQQENALYTALGGLDGLRLALSGGGTDYQAIAAAWAAGLRDAGFVPGGGQLQAIINIDGRETAIVLTPYISEELGWQK